MFSIRTNWQRKPNRLTELYNLLRDNGEKILDLTASNPTQCGIVYPANEILPSLGNPRSLQYDPQPQGIIPARKAVCAYYRSRDVDLSPHQVFLTASTSEAYSTVFKLLCNAGDEVLIPRPSYPLFEYLAQINDVAMQHYSLRYDGVWHIDFDSLTASITEKTKAIIIIHPHNPTGMFLKKYEHERLVQIATEHRLALIVDEVFLEYGFSDYAEKFNSSASERRVLTFTLNGISKMIGMPQMKLGWIVLSGPDVELAEASHRLEMLCDTFLSVNTPVQEALSTLFQSGESVREQIMERIKSNYAFLDRSLGNGGNCSLISSEGGWYGIIRVPRIKSDEEWCIGILRETKVYLYAGYHFDFEEEGFLIVSLLPENKIFEDGVQRIIEYIDKTSFPK